MEWEAKAKIDFDQIMEKIPVFMRPIALQKVSRKAEMLAVKDHRSIVSYKDMVDAFFAETPFGFHGPLKADMTSIGIDFTQYGHPA